MVNNGNYSSFPLHGETIDNVDDRESIVIHYDDDGNSDSDFDSTEVNSNSTDAKSGDFTRIGMVKIEDRSNEYEIITKGFLRTMGVNPQNWEILAVHRNSVADPSMKARRDAFKISAQAVAEKCGGDPNVWLAWYISSTEEIRRIISYGFSYCGEPVNGETHGIGVQLFPAKFPLVSLNSVHSSILNNNGVCHMMLCRVIMGKMEQIPVGSNQFQPSSRDYDSGVDNITEPRRLTVWSAFMNSHIFPAHVVTFRPCSFNGRNPAGILKPKSPWMSFPELINLLSKRLEPSTMALILKFYNEFRSNKIPRQIMIQRLRRISGDRLLSEIIKSCRQKVLDLFLAGLVQIMERCCHLRPMEQLCYAIETRVASF